ncbi:MAG TPA: nuclear transport factor 2 family protein [Longimicrobiales bacterium]|nr:nuclear transport factor 2 family protein [Longimicrobiales bacterium]
MQIRNRVFELVARVEAGDFLGAFEEFYSDDVVMRENAGVPTRGKAANRERERAFVGAIRTIHENRAAAVVVDGNRVAINWNAEYTFADGRRLRFDQIAFQHWENDRVVCEQFYYDSATLASEQAA